jgi:hypothetical protein
MPIAKSVAAHLQIWRQRSASNGHVDCWELFLSGGHASLGREQRVCAQRERREPEAVVDDPEEAVEEVAEVWVAFSRCKGKI